MQTFRVSVVAAAFVVAVTLVGRAADAISAPDAELQYQLGNLLFEDTRYQDALAAYDKATE